MADPNAHPVSRFIRIRGTVQGVGFRPFVYRLAARLGIRGEVWNDSDGVAIHAVAREEVMERFVALLRDEAPPLSSIRSIEVASAADCPGAGESFTISESRGGGKAAIDIARDTAVCESCLREMRDPADRRFGYAFINCTDCGPRYTIISALPYDRPNTTMASFSLCPECRWEYEDPASRRFHAEPICCAACGPRLAFLDEHGKQVESNDPVALCIESLNAGRIVAIKGIGGFHLACRADLSAAVKRLRSRKGREEKPFALMARDRAAAETVLVLSEEEARLLSSIERPIVLAAKRPDPAATVCDEVAPGLPAYGIMLPYAPMHHLLFDAPDFQLLVMTSANRTDEPMVHTNSGALQALAGIADAFLVHDRPILMRTDDSIARVAAGSPLLLRRGRGFVPEPMPAPCDVSGIVGCGGVLKSTVAVGRGASCYVSQYVGSAETVETIEQLDEIKRHLLGILDVEPSLYALDLHPASAVAHIADPGVPCERIQHHHAHAAACMAENRITGTAVCVVYDGTGYGIDETMWGGEFFVSDCYDFARAGHLKPMLMPGGEAAIRHPWRMAMGALFPRLGAECGRFFPGIPPEEKRAVLELLDRSVSCIATSGMGRLFDALSALLGICIHRVYEGQPAILLESHASPSPLERDAYDVLFESDASGAVVIDGAAILQEAVEDFESGTEPRTVASRFHETIAKATALVAGRIAERSGTEVVCLSGGCFQNALLLERSVERLRAAGLRPVVHRLMPPNDESISYGQVVIAGMRRSGQKA